MDLISFMYPPFIMHRTAPVHVEVEASIYSRQTFGGISTYVTEVFTRISRSPDFCVRLRLRHPVIQSPPSSCKYAVTGRTSAPNKWVRRTTRAFALTAQIASRIGLHVVPGRRRYIIHNTYYESPRIMHVPVVATIYDMAHERLPALFCTGKDDRFRQQKARSLTSAHHIISISRAAKEDMCDYYEIAENRVSVVPLAASNAYYPDENLDNTYAACGRPYVLYVGARWHYKNFALLIRALASPLIPSDVFLVVAGPEFTREERELVDTFNLTHRVVAVERPSVDILRKLYSNALMFVYPSRFEGFGIPLVEAMACGAPVAASRIPVFQEVAGDAAEYFDPCDVDSLVVAINRLLDPVRADELRQLGFARQRLFSWDKTASLTQDVYRSLLGIG